MLSAADELCDPTDTKQTFVEELIRLPHCFLCYTPATGHSCIFVSTQVIDSLTHCCLPHCFLYCTTSYKSFIHSSLAHHIADSLPAQHLALGLLQHT